MLELAEYSRCRDLLVRLRGVSFFPDDGDFSVEVGIKNKRPVLSEVVKAPSRVVLMREIRENVYDNEDIEIKLDPGNERNVKIFFTKRR